MTDEKEHRPMTDTVTTAEPTVEVMPPAAEPKPWEAIPDGDFAIVELFGHTTLVGRIAEVEQFGAKMLAIQPLFSGTELPVVLHGGSAIYRLTRCSREVAWAKQPKDDWSLPASIKAIIPPAALPAPTPLPERYRGDGTMDDDEDDQVF